MVLTQMWELEAGTGVIRQPKGAQILSGKAHFLSPYQWERLYLPWKIEVTGGCTLCSCLQREELVSGVVRTVGGMLRLDIYNASGKVVRITPKTPLVSVGGYEDLEVVRLAAAHLVEAEITDESLATEIGEKFADVGNLSRHPIVTAMRSMTVRADEVSWSLPQTQGMRTPYKAEQGACRLKVTEQLEQYIERGYLRRVSSGERVALSPLLPIEKSDGSYRFTNDFRWLNAHFSKAGMAQVDVWRRLWEISPNWKYFAKLDLKDGFFAIPVDEQLQRAFAFTWQDHRYAWTRLPQGWAWSPILFSERVAEIVEGLGTIQYVDDLLVGAESKAELREKLLEVFTRLQAFGLKVNLRKTSFLQTKVVFLGIEIEDGGWSLAEYLRRKKEQLGPVLHWKDLERLIGILSYVRHTVVDLERTIAPIRVALLEAKAEQKDEAWWCSVDETVREVLKAILSKQAFLMLPGPGVERYVLETDWSGSYAGYVLWAQGSERDHLCDIGSKKVVEHTSSFLGELKAVVWACKATKSLRGSAPLVIHTDNQALARQLGSCGKGYEDKRALRLIGWLVGNEDFEVEFLPGSENLGADLLSRPRPQRRQIVRANLTEVEKRKALELAHKGHWNWKRTWENLRLREETWPRARHEVKDFVRKCPQCARFGPMAREPRWSSWSCPEPNDTVFCDFAGPLRWPGRTETVYVFVIVDGLSRYATLMLSRGPTAEAAKRGVKKWCERCGPPRRLVSDQGRAFTSKGFTDSCKARGIEVASTPPYAHWSNGLVERAIGTLVGRIKREGPGKPWPVILNRAERAYNVSWHSAIKAAPITVMLGIRPNGLRLTKEERRQMVIRAASMGDEVRKRQRARETLGPTLRAPLKVGDRVALREFHRENKLSPEWSGNYEVAKQEGQSLFILRNMSGGEIGPFHARHLKKIW